MKFSLHLGFFLNTCCVKKKSDFCCTLIVQRWFDQTSSVDIMLDFGLEVGQKCSSRQRRAGDFKSYQFSSTGKASSRTELPAVSVIEQPPSSHAAIKHNPLWKFEKPSKHILFLTSCFFFGFLRRTRLGGKRWVRRLWGLCAPPGPRRLCLRCLHSVPRLWILQPPATSWSWSCASWSPNTGG